MNESGFAQGADAQDAPPCLRPLVLGSWRRSRGAKVRPEHSDLPPVRLAPDALEEHRRGHRLRTLLPLFRELLGESASDDGHIWAVSDADGVLLWVEGDSGTLRRAERMNFVPGAAWSESQAGTNAPGTALELGQAVQIIGPEHYKEVAQPWACSAAPLRDPDTGQLLGTVDITGAAQIGSPQALTAIRATAKAAETELARASARSDDVAREQYLQVLERAREPLALVTPAGRVLHAAPGFTARHLGHLTPGPARLSDGTRVYVEPVGTFGHLLVSPHEASWQPPGSATPVQLRALGIDNAELRIDGRVERLSPRHSEIMVALVLSGAGVCGERLGLDLYGDEAHPVTLRAEISRLRALLGSDVLGSRPYTLRRRVRADFRVVCDLLAEGRPADALTAYRGPLLPSSEAPAIVDVRTVVEQQLRAAVLASRDPSVLRRWVDEPWGANDLHAWETLVRLLPAPSPQRAAAIAQARAVAG